MMRIVVVSAALLFAVSGCALSPPNTTAGDDIGSLSKHWDQTTTDLGETFSVIGSELWWPSSFSAGQDLKFLFTDPPTRAESRAARLAASETESAD